MAVREWNPGDLARIDMSFEVDGAPADPTTVKVYVASPSGSQTIYDYSLAQITRTAEGVYYMDLSLTVEGIWRWRTEGTGACQAADEGQIYVKSSVFV